MIKIMLVEDDKSLREIYGVRLLAEGYEIVSAGDGEEALAMAVKEHPDLILSDVMMPKISGFDMLDILRATPETRDIKVIMMTALSSEDQRARGEALGANRYLVKSQVGIEDVVRTIHEVLLDTPGATLPTPTPAAQPATQAPAAAPAAQPPQPPVTPPVTPAAVPTQPTTPGTPLQGNVPAGLTPIIPSGEPSKDIIVPGNVIIPEPVKITPEGVQHVNAASVQLPQPTAPFSTPAPASLGNSTQLSSSQAKESLLGHEISGTTPPAQNIPPRQ